VAGREQDGAQPDSRLATRGTRVADERPSGAEGASLRQHLFGSQQVRLDPGITDTVRSQRASVSGVCRVPPAPDGGS
jgi:hypothetical protein